MTTLNSIDIQQSTVYLNALMEVAMTDGVFHEKEKEYIAMQAAMIGIAVPDFDNYKPENGLPLSNLPQKVKKCIVKDCIVLAMVDENYSQAEKGLILQMAKDMGLDEDFALQIETWVNDFVNVTERGRILFQ